MRSRSERGNATLMATVVSIAVAAALVTLSRKHKDRTQLNARSQIKAARDQVFVNLRGIISAPAAIQVSVNAMGAGDGNVELANCINESGAEDCLATGSDTFVGFQLFDELQKSFSTPWPEDLRDLQMVPSAKGDRWPDTLKLFSGIPFPKPQFDRKAVRCKEDESCPVAPYTAFRAWCPYPVSVHGLASPNESGTKDLMVGRPTKCDKAEFIQFFIAVGGSYYAVGTVPKLTAGSAFTTRHNFTAGSPSRLGSRTRDPDEILLTVDEINNNGARLCPDGMSSVGLDANGYPRCEYATNPCVVSGDAKFGKIIAAFENGQLVCRKPFQGESCAELEVFYGVTADGQLDCRRPRFNTGCKTDEIAVEFDSKGDPVCIRAHTGQACEPPSILVGFDADGIAVCKTAEILFAGQKLNPEWFKNKLPPDPVVNKVEKNKSFVAFCIGCHGGDKPTAGVTLLEIQKKYKGNPKGLVEYAKDPRAVNPNSKMPTMANVDDEELNKIAEWILNLVLD